MAGKWIRNCLRFTIYRRDNFTCGYCGIKCELNSNDHNGISLDHIIPQSDPRSTNKPDNLIVSCKGCNSRRQDKPIEDWLHENNINPIIVELRVSKPIDHKLRKRFYNMPVKQARAVLMAMY